MQLEEYGLRSDRINSIEQVLQLERFDPYVALLRESRIEEFPFEQTQEFTLFRLDQLTQSLRLNPIFRNRLDSAGIRRIKSWADWQEVPISSRDDLSAYFNQSKDGFVIPWSCNEYFPVASGGTTKNPVVTFHRDSEVDNVTSIVGRYWHDYILGRTGNLDGRLLAILSEAANGWATHYLIGEMCRKTGVNFVAMGPMTSEVTADIWFNTIGLTDLKGTAADFTNLVHLLNRQQYPQVRSIMYGGEPLPPSTLDGIRSVFPNANTVGTYSSTQALGIGAQLVGEQGMRIFPTNHIEILRGDGSVANYGEEGTVHITRLMGLSGVLPRFNIADQGVIYRPDPQDPIQLPILELKGRTGEVVRFGQYEIDLKEFYQNIYPLIKRLILEATDSSSTVIHNMQLHMNGQQGQYNVKISTHSGELFLIDQALQDKIIRRAMIQSATVFSGMQAYRLDQEALESAPYDLILQDVEKATSDLPSGMVHLGIDFVDDNQIVKSQVGKVLAVVNQSN